jgi:HTH-type transcriptional regulator/antitoxin HigA
MRELEARGWTQKDLAEITGRPVQTINEIVQAKKQITPETALDLSAALGTSAEFWTNLETNYRLHLARKEQQERDKERQEQNIARKSTLYSLAPVSELIKRGWIQGSESIEELEQQVCNFFGISTTDEPPLLALSLRCAQDRNPEQTAQLTWAKRVENLVRQQETGSFDRGQLQAAIPDILACAAIAENVARVPNMLLALGVHFAIVPHLNKTYLDGAAFYLDSHPVVALTLRYDRIDSFWFTLMHELGHIAAGHQGSYLDNLENLEVNVEEAEANRLAANWLVDSVAFQAFIATTKPHFSRKAIETFAKQQQRHPGIILGRLHHEDYVPHKNLRALLVKVSPHLEKWTDRIITGTCP